ncbi:MAG: branched-chain alpha-keto acid dehydrogenase subunit E2 [Pedosphaera sp.]|nr:branched-chain alpha-keto acid dehydrogenase subunit E2 [Pedosphaera sp.]
MDVRFPKIGDGAEGGKVVSVLVKAGDTITTGQTILELESEKAIAPIPSPSAGTVASVIVKEGDTIAVGTILLTLEGSGSPPSAPPKSKSITKKIAPLVTKDDESESDIVTGDESEEGPTPAASPYVRKVARDLGIRLSRVRGSGSGGRVQLEDLARYVSKLEAKVARAGRYAEGPQGLSFPLVNQDFGLYGPVTSEPLTALRKIISSRMLENKVTLPHVTQFDEADMSVIETLRIRHKAAYEAAGVKLTPTPFIIKALVGALQKHPKFNSSLNEVAEVLVLKQYFHIGIAVDTDAGLLVPVLKDADKKSLLEISRELALIAPRARDRKVGAEEMKGGTFTISNQGAIGGSHFTPIINKPEVAILGLGKSRLKPIVTTEGRIEARLMMPLTISYDHRVIDGGAAARFTVDLVKAIEGFEEAEVKL